MNENTYLKIIYETNMGNNARWAEKILCKENKTFKFQLKKGIKNFKMLKTLNFEEPYVGTSVENQIWLSGRVAR